MQKYVLIYNTPLHSWYVLGLLSVIVTGVCAVYFKPKDYQIDRFGLAMFYLLALFLAHTGAHWGSLVVKGPLPAMLGLPAAFGTKGRAFLGAAAGVVFAAFLFTKCRKKRLSFLKLMDYFSPFLMLNQSIVRIGCFAKGCCGGKPTTLPWGCAFHDKLPLRHPTQVYEFTYLIVIFLVMRHVYSRGSRAGEVFFGTFFLYGFLRFFNEFLRIDSPAALGTITLAQVIMAALAIICGAAILIIRRAK